MLQTWCWAKIVYALLNAAYIDTNSAFIQFAAYAEEVGRNGNLWQTLANNIWNGQLYSNFWQVEAGHIFQTSALFLFGMWLGRKSYFEKSDVSRNFWIKAVVFSAIMCLPLYLLSRLVPAHIENVTIQAYYGVAIPMLYNFAFMTFLVAGFMLLWFHSGNGYSWQRFITPFGRMSLTNYISQSIIGVVVYYHFGLNLWCHAGAVESIIIGISIFGALLGFSRFWLQNHRQGSLEYLWKKWT